MKKYVYIILICFFISPRVIAQEAMESKQMIGITPMVFEQLGLPADAHRSLSMKLRQISVRNGFGSASGAFVLTADPVIVDKQMTATAPSQFIVNVDLSMYIVNVAEMSIVSELTVSLRGVDRLENKAMISAINSLSSSNPTVRNFMENSRKKIISYYTTNIPTILAQAETLVDMENYDGALRMLSSVPDFVDQYPAVLDLMTQTYKKNLEMQTLALIKAAKSEIINGNYTEALTIINKTNPTSPNAKEAYAVIDVIEGKIETQKAKEDANNRLALEEQKRRFDLQREDMLRGQEDKAELDLARVDAMTKVNEQQSKTSKLSKKQEKSIVSLLFGDLL